MIIFQLICRILWLNFNDLKCIFIQRWTIFPVTSHNYSASSFFYENPTPCSCGTFRFFECTQQHSGVIMVCPLLYHQEPCKLSPQTMADQINHTLTTCHCQSTTLSLKFSVKQPSNTLLMINGRNFNKSTATTATELLLWKWYFLICCRLFSGITYPWLPSNTKESTA